MKGVLQHIAKTILWCGWSLASIFPPAYSQKCIRVWYQYGNRSRHAQSRLGRPIVFIAMPKSASKTIAKRTAAALGTTIVLIARKRGGQIWPANTTLNIREVLYASLTRKVLHEHCVADNITIDQLKRVTDHVVVHIRDPRQVLVSMMHHFFDAEEDVDRFGIEPDRINPEDWTSTLDYLIDEVFPVLLKYVIDWHKVSKEGSLDVSFVTYELFVRDPSQYFSNLFAIWEGSPGLPVPDINQHFRKGDSSEWRNILTKRQQERVNRVIPPVLLEEFNWPRH